MQTEYLSKQNSSTLILFFNGWGMNNSILEHLKNTEFDILCFSNYDNDYIFDDKVTKGYKKIYLVAWSMGVWASAKTLENLNIKFDKKIAINGTLKPISDNFGIPISIFEGTINNFSERNKMKFDKRMLGSKEDFLWFQNLKSKRENITQLEELKLIYKNALNPRIDFTFDEIIIGQEDLIFPVKNQLKFWENRGAISTIKCPHFPFQFFNSWSDIIGING